MQDLISTLVSPPNEKFQNEIRKKCGWGNCKRPALPVFANEMLCRTRKPKIIVVTTLRMRLILSFAFTYLILSTFIAFTYLFVYFHQHSCMQTKHQEKCILLSTVHWIIVIGIVVVSILINLPLQSSSNAVTCVMNDFSKPISVTFCAKTRD
jgi:hypothetical protein